MNVPISFAFQNLKEECDWRRRERRHYIKIHNISNVFPREGCNYFEVLILNTLFYAKGFYFQ